MVLVISPEYSCPKEILYKLIEHKSFPDEGKLWILGSESLKVSELNLILQKIDKKDNVTWICEEKILNSKNDSKFLDPLFYFFKTKNYSGSMIDVVLIQFKCSPMGGDDFEKKRLLLGEVVYILRNKNSSINLFSLICSDSLEFDLNKALNNQKIDLKNKP